MEQKTSHRPLRIAIVLEKFLPSRGGERYFTFLSEELAARGHEVHLFTGETEESSLRGVAVHLVPMWKIPFGLGALSFLWNSAKALSAYDFDIIHGVAMCLAMNVYNPHGGVEKAYLKQEFSSVDNPLYRYYKMIRRYLSVRHYLEITVQKRLFAGKRVKRVIAISNMIKRDIISYYGFPEERIDTVFNTVDLERFHPRNREHLRMPSRAFFGIEENTLVLLFAGNNYRLKGLGTLFSALSTLQKRYPQQSLCLLVVGRGRVKTYARLARKLGVSGIVRLLGAVTDVTHFYAASDVYVHPTYYDSCSLTVLEALASGLPVITTRFNGASDALERNDAGIILDDPSDSAALAEAIAFFFDEEAREKAGAAGRRSMERFPLSSNIEATLRVYEKVVNERLHEFGHG